MNDDQEKALKTEGEAENILGATPAPEEQAAEEVSKPEEEATAETKGQETETVESPKKSAQHRIGELTAKAKQAEAGKVEAETKAQSLADKLAELTGSVEPQAVQPPFIPQAEPGTEISPEQYRQDVMRTADALVQLRVKQSEAVNKINNEATEVIRLYPKLDPDSNDFDQELSETVSEATEAYVKANPYQASVKKFVAKLMKPYERAVAKEVGEQSEKLAKQVSQSALRPTQVATSEKKFEELSIKEMEEKLGVVQT